jgi:hypothetical protein
MSAFDSEMSRISKLLIDRDQVDPAAALADRQSFAVTLGNETSARSAEA